MMYLLLCPCIRDPSLRAAGITHERDLEAFDRLHERCRRFNIPIRYLPCPETRYLGKNREPATFSERLDTPAFREVLEGCRQETLDLIAHNGPPYMIIGVDSSPTCGVNRNWRSPAGREPGRGLFLGGFPGITARDVFAAAAFRVYLAAPLFSEAERAWNLRIAGVLRSQAYEVHLPQETGDTDSARGEAVFREIFQKNLAALDASDLVVAVIDGADADSGTCWEMGYAYAKGIPVISLRTDFRIAGYHEQVNLMLEQAAYMARNLKDLVSCLPCPIPVPGLSPHDEQDYCRGT